MVFIFRQMDSSAQNNMIREDLIPLNFLAGEWDVAVDARLSKQGPWEKSKARSVIKKAIGETIFEEEYTGTKQGRTLVAKTWIGNDNRTKLYQRISVDSDHGVLIVFEGRLGDNILTLYASLDLSGTKLIHRIQYSLINPHSFVVESSRSADDGNTWDRTGTLKYTRKE